eukprot:7504697-Lingulodinium_polyedra.AAC.1
MGGAIAPTTGCAAMGVLGGGGLRPSKLWTSSSLGPRLLLAPTRASVAAPLPVLWRLPRRRFC